jgi:hypothetical protein
MRVPGGGSSIVPPLMDYALNIAGLSGNAPSASVCDSRINRRERPGGACYFRPFECYPISVM